MISAHDFVLSYSEWFSYICENHGHDEVERLWEVISDEFLGHFRKLIAEKGFKGMMEHWGRTLDEEQAECDITLDNNEFRISMHRCPSVKMLYEAKHMEKYPRYCEHCYTLYGRILANYGFHLGLEYIDQEKGVCEFTITKSRLSESDAS